MIQYDVSRVCSFHYKGLLFYAPTQLENGLHRVHLYIHCHTQIRSFLPTLPQKTSISSCKFWAHSDNF
jgi:hypothetical protein